MPADVATRMSRRQSRNADHVAPSKGFTTTQIASKYGYIRDARSFESKLIGAL
jgi:hypothetical protein